MKNKKNNYITINNKKYLFNKAGCFGCNKLYFIGRGEGSDPDLLDLESGLVFNYNELADELWAIYDADAEQNGEKATDEGFIVWQKQNGGSVYDIMDCIAESGSDKEKDAHRLSCIWDDNGLFIDYGGQLESGCINFGGLLKSLNI